MNCPVCNGRLRAIEKYGVEIDICPDCKGVWLDRGELEKILELESAGGPMTDYDRPRVGDTRPIEVAPLARQEYRGHDRDDHDDHDDHDHDRRRHDASYQQRGYSGQKRRSSWLGDLLGGLGGDD